MRARILLALAAMTGALLLAGSPAAAQDYPPVEPTLTVTPTTVVAGGTVEVTGTGFEPNETVLLTISIAPFAAPQVGVDDLTGDQVAMVPVAQNLAAPAVPELAGGWELTVQADDEGSFTTTITLRKPGIATITATGLESGLSASVTVTVLAAKDGLPETGSDVWRLIRIGGAGIVLGGMLLIGARPGGVSGPDLGRSLGQVISGHGGEPAVSVDQFQMRDPRQQYRGAEEQGREQQPHPGWTGGLGREPDHGEDTYRGTGRLQGRRALITGGDSGIGRAVALAYAREGADLVIAYLPEEEEDAQTTVELVRDAERTAIPVPGDIRSRAFCDELVERTVSELGGLDLLVNNAAFQMAQPGGIADITDDQFDRTVKTNLYGMFWLCRAAVPAMPAGSTIINVTSIQAVESSPALLDYATTKAGIIAFTKALAVDVARRGIRVNAVGPGPIWTPLIPATMPEGKVEQFGSETPLGRAGQPAEVAPAFVYLASQESSYVTGEVIAVTGGRPMS